MPAGFRLLAVSLLALATHFGYLALDRDYVEFDSVLYVRTTDSLLAGRGFTDDGEAETLRTPGYPLFLAALRAMGLDLRGIVVVQHLLAVMMVAILFLAGRNSATAAAVLLAIDLPTIVHANKILTETLFTFLLLVVFVLAWRIAEGVRHPLLIASIAGFLTGVATLVRPIAVFFFVPLALYFAWTRRRAVIAPFVICALVLPAIWIIRNHRATGVATLSSLPGHHMLFLRAAGVLAIGDPGDFAANLHRRQNEMQALANRRISPHLPHAQRAEAEMRIGREIVMQHPLALVKLVARGLAATMLGGSAAAVSKLTAIPRERAEQFLLAYTGLALLLALIGQVTLLKTNRRLGVLILITLAYFIVLSAGAESYSRFRVPVVPMYAIAIAAGLETIVRFTLTHRRARFPRRVFERPPCA